MFEMCRDLMVPRITQILSKSLDLVEEDNGDCSHKQMILGLLPLFKKGMNINQIFIKNLSLSLVIKSSLAGMGQDEFITYNSCG